MCNFRETTSIKIVHQIIRLRENQLHAQTKTEPEGEADLNKFDHGLRRHARYIDDCEHLALPIIKRANNFIRVWDS